jgi:hypothetical protein
MSARLFGSSLVFFLLFGGAGALFGQADTEIGDFWFRLQINKKLDKRWSIGTDLQLRRQDEYVFGDQNIFRLPSVYSVRLWAFCKLDKNWTLIYSPAAFFQNYQLRNSGELSGTRELRTQAGGMHSLELGRFTLRNRLLYEYRWIDFDREVFRHQHRLRLQNAVFFKLAQLSEKSRLDLMFFNEFFFATPDYRSFGFDQNRDFLGVRGQHGFVDWALGYQYTRHRQGEIHFNRHSLLTSLNLNF